MRLLRRFSFSAFALVLVSIAATCIAQESVGLFLVAGTLAAMSWYVTEGPRGRTLPRWVSNILVIAVSLSAVADFATQCPGWEQHREDVVGVLGRFGLWLTLIKLYERRTARDHGHLLVLSVLLILIGCLQAGELLFGLLLGLYMILGLYVVLLYQMQTAYEQSKAERDAAIPRGYRLVPPLRPIVARHAVWHVRLLVLLISVLGLALSGVIFLAVPRDVGTNMLAGTHASRHIRQSGFSWEIDLISGGRLTDSHAKVCTLRVTDDGGRPIPRSGPIRLRGAVLDRYDGRGHWSSHPAQVRRIELFSGELTSLEDSIEPSEGFIVQRVRLHSAHDGAMPLFSINSPVAVRSDSPLELLYDPLRHTIRTSETTHALRTYTVVSQPEFMSHPPRPGAQWADVAGWDSNYVQAYRPRVRQLAHELLAAEQCAITPPSREEDRWRWNHLAATIFARHLHSDSFTYSTDLRDVAYRSRDDDPIIHFLFSTRRGHCEFYASALTALCDSVDIPARVVAGYVAFDADPNSGEYHVLESNAHAWVEIASGPGRWTTIDPTPPGTLEELQATPSRFMDHIRWAYQRLDGEWSAGIIGFDRRDQANFTEAINQTWSKRLDSTVESVRDWMERVNRAFYFGPAGYIWMGIVACALVIAVVALIKLMRRSLALRRTLRVRHIRGVEYQQMMWQLGFYLDMLEVLSRGGHPKPRWQPPVQFAHALSTQAPGASRLALQITDLFYRSRYGRQRLSRGQITLARRLVSELANVLHVKR